MNYLFKQQSLKELVQFNRCLLFICSFLVITTCILTVLLGQKEERWILIPATNPDQRMEISSKGFSETYLKNWASYVMQTLMTTSNDTIDAQIEEIQVISSNSEELTRFFKKHKSFVKGSNIHSVFYPKTIDVQIDAATGNFNDEVLVSGLFRYWLGGGEKAVSLQKTYSLTFKRGSHDVLLLKNVVEVVD